MSAAGRATGLIVAAAATLALGGCEGVQSALAPGGEDAARISLLAWVLFLGGGAIFLLVMVAMAVAIYGPAALRQSLAADAFVVAAGLVFPVVTLTVLLGYGLMLSSASPLPSDQSEPFRLTVIGERWWWRVIYRDGEGRRFESANEVRIPVGRPVEISLRTNDVIHSFWVPRLAGKLDMIPGRTNVLRLSARNAGVSRGQCAEYCGGAHALMAFYVVAMEPPAFDTWLSRAASPSREPQDPIAQLGLSLFLTSGCIGCHTIRGTEAAGVIGPDLTHVGDRVSLGAGIMPNDAPSIARWIVRNQHIKPDNLMPPFGIFNASELSALSTYLASLR